MSRRILSLGAGVQSTAMAILLSQNKLDADEVIFADPGGEKPETYWYIEHYLEPLFAEVQIPFTRVRTQPHNLVEYCKHKQLIPSIVYRWCTDKFKVRPMAKHLELDSVLLIGFSSDEIQRAERAKSAARRAFPLIELGLSSTDCRRIISDYGWPVPIKSSCFFCPFQRWTEWNYLKLRHPELVKAAVDMEYNLYERRPDLRDSIGLFGGAPLWKWQAGIQLEMPLLKEYSCKSGFCGH